MWTSLLPDASFFVMMRKARIGYGLFLVVALGVFLFVRRAGLLAGSASAVDALAAAVFLAVLLLPIFNEVTLGGVTLKRLEEIVQREVGKAQIQALQLAARRDLAMMSIWEKENSSVPSDFSQQKVELL